MTEIHKKSRKSGKRNETIMQHWKIMTIPDGAKISTNQPNEVRKKCEILDIYQNSCL